MICLGIFNFPKERLESEQQAVPPFPRIAAKPLGFGRK
jgi:hypothetical protein